MSVTYHNNKGVAYGKGTELKELMSDLKMCDYWFPVLHKPDMKKKIAGNRQLRAMWDRAQKDGIKPSQIGLIGGYRKDLKRDQYFIVSREDVEYLAEMLAENFDPTRIDPARRLRDSEKPMIDPESI